MKPWYASKTIMFNLLATIVAFVAASLPQLQSIMSPQVYVLFSLAVGVVNVALRFITTEAIGKEQPPG